MRTREVYSEVGGIWKWGCGKLEMGMQGFFSAEEFCTRFAVSDNNHNFATKYTQSIQHMTLVPVATRCVTTFLISLYA